MRTVGADYGWVETTQMILNPNRLIPARLQGLFSPRPEEMPGVISRYSLNCDKKHRSNMAKNSHQQ